MRAEKARAVPTANHMLWLSLKHGNSTDPSTHNQGLLLAVLVWLEITLGCTHLSWPNIIGTVGISMQGSPNDCKMDQNEGWIKEPWLSLAGKVVCIYMLFSTGEKKHARRAISNDFHQLHAKNEHFTAWTWHWNAAKTRGNLALQTVAFDRSIGTSIVAVASTFKRHSMFRWKDPEHKRFDDKLETGKEWRFGIEVKWKGGHRLFWQGCTSPTYRPRPWESISATSKNTLSKWRPYAIRMLWFQFGGAIGMSSLRDTTSNRWSESQPSVAWLQSSPWWPW